MLMKDEQLHPGRKQTLEERFSVLSYREGGWSGHATHGPCDHCKTWSLDPGEICNSINCYFHSESEKWLSLFTSDTLQKSVWLCDCMDYSLPGSSDHGICQTRILEVAIPFYRRSFQPRDPTRVSCIAVRFFNIWATREYTPYNGWK